MRLRRGLPSMLVIAVVAGIAALLMWAFLRGREELTREQAGERPITAPSRVRIEDGETVITVDRATQRISGLVAASLEPHVYQAEVKAYGTVVGLQDLVDVRNSFVAAKVHLEQARIELTVSRKEYERLKALHADHQNISDKALQAAEAKWRADEANARAAQAALHLVEDAARQRWGSVLAVSVSEASPAVDRLLRQQDLLMQLTLPPGTHLPSAPQTARVQVTDGTLISATLVSPSPHTDPRVQGLSFFYVASAATPRLVPGMNVLAYLPVGPQVSGVVIPAPAIVWWQGKAWVYVQQGADRFVRREVPTENQVHDGWFVTREFSAGDRLVVRGAQALLSEEFRARIQVRG